MQITLGVNSLSQNLTVLPAPSGREPLAWRHSFRLKCKACGRACSPGGAVAQRLRGCKSAEPEKTVKRSSRQTGVNLQFFPVEPSSLGLKWASSPFFVAPARRNRWHFSGSLLVSKENIPGSYFPTQKRSNTCSITASEAFSPVRSHRAASASSTQTETASSPKPPAAASSAPATASRARSAAES